jgi:formamidopyrimidine-DNA glycosylase
VPELPEVEVVRRGLHEHVLGATIESVQVLHPRAVRRHEPGPRDLALQLTGQTIAAVQRRGKYLWLVLEPADVALVVHLGMSGQMLVQPPSVPDEKHLRIRAVLDNGADLRFVDQRTFGGWAVAPLVEVDGDLLPVPVAHIARDPMDPRFDADAVVKVLRGKHTEIKRALLDQTVVSGVGNIYADESLWRAKLHGNRITDTLSRPKLGAVLAAAREVMGEALAQGGTSFDALYVNVNGESGYFDRSLDVYGQENRPCSRCGAAIRREKFMNRSSYSCPKCQPRPRGAGRPRGCT